MIEQLKKHVEEAEKSDFTEMAIPTNTVRYLIGETERLQKDNKLWIKQNKLLTRNNADYRAHVEELRKALEWYADENNYQIRVEGTTSKWPIMGDKGERARQALERE